MYKTIPMKTNANELIEDLINRTKENINHAQHFQELGDTELNWRLNEESWSVLECFEHLNLYGDYYLPEIKKQINRQIDRKAVATFKSSWLGNYFAESLAPKEKLNKMKTFKDKNPLGSKLDNAVLNRFIVQQKEMLELLSSARAVNLTTVKTGISISKWIKLRLGDTFRVVIYHNQRHIVQAKNAIEMLNLTIA